MIVENRIAALRRSDPSVDDVASLIKGLRSDSRPELELALFDVLSTNHTHFFRESDHLDVLKKEVLDPATAARKKGLRIWSAGRHFTHAPATGRDSYRIDPSLAGIVSFGRLNLLERWPMKGPFDAILCRNVMIYFDPQTTAHVVSTLYERLAPGGYLLVGESERIHGNQGKLEYKQPTEYQKVG